MIDFNKTNNPILIAEEFAEIEKSYGYEFNFSIQSLEIELERFLETKHYKDIMKDKY